MVVHDPDSISYSSSGQKRIVPKIPQEMLRANYDDSLVGKSTSPSIGGFLMGNLLIPIGLIGTTIAILSMARSMMIPSGGGQRLFDLSSRWRIGMQGFTVVAMLGGSYKGVKDIQAERTRREEKYAREQPVAEAESSKEE